jgi:hypothetical protein
MTLDGHEILARFWPSRKTRVWMAARHVGQPERRSTGADLVISAGEQSF